jgi:hypothetical protein
VLPEEGRVPHIIRGHSLPTGLSLSPLLGLGSREMPSAEALCKEMWPKDTVVFPPP